MVKSYARLLVFVFLGSCLVPLVTAVCTRLNTAAPLTSGFLAKSALLAFAVLVATAAFYLLLKRLEALLDSHSSEQAQFLDTFPLRYVDLAIFGSAALSLLLELAVIRWQATVFEFFAFYKNFGLLSCFAGLGLGYALANRERIPLALVVPLLGWQFGLMITLRFGMPVERLESLRVLPFREQLSGGVRVASVLQGIAIYFFLSVIFLTVVLTFIPVGQLCGRLMERREKLRAYGLNLLGSLFGVILIFLLSFLWTPPLIWYALCFGGLLLFYPSKRSSLMLGVSFTTASVLILAWPVNPLWPRIYSPYQLLELGHSDKGLMLIRAAGTYHQQVRDLSPASVVADSKLKTYRDAYDLPYRIHRKWADVAVVGAGTGNDVAAALRAGAQRVEAIEIDPAILMLGKANHPERPYHDPRVRVVVNDARSFFRTTDKTYDMVVYGVLDSHTLLSHASSVRLDSFVYTVEGLREARARLKDDGVLSISFWILNDTLGRKIYTMMQEAFGGHPPVCVSVGGDSSRVIFLQSKGGDLVLPSPLLEETGFQDRTRYFANLPIRTDVSTDDWPFFYMPRRIYPLSYLVMLGVALIISCFVTTSFLAERPQFSSLAFFFLGAGFMLVETKGITEMGLTFGNTWQVIGIVIASILVMAFLANCVVQWLRIKSPVVAYLLLLASLAFGWLIAREGGLPSTTLGHLATVVLLTCPIFFSGVVFSTLLASGAEISGIIAMNLLGAMCGGLVEYNSMYFGFRFLYLTAMAFYFVGFTVSHPMFEQFRFRFAELRKSNND